MSDKWDKGILQRTDFKQKFCGVCVFRNLSSLFPKICNKNGKKAGEGANLEWYSDLTFINSKNFKFLEQTGTLFCLDNFFFPLESQSKCQGSSRELLSLWYSCRYVKLHYTINRKYATKLLIYLHLCSALKGLTDTKCYKTHHYCLWKKFLPCLQW